VSVFFATPSHKCSDTQLGELLYWAQNVANKLKLDSAGVSVVSNCPWLDEARASLVSSFLAGPCRYLFFRDDDIFIGPDVLKGLMDLNVPIAIAPYRWRIKPHPWALRMEWSVITKSGLGACLIQRHVIERMVERYSKWTPFGIEDLTYDESGSSRVGLFDPIYVPMPGGKRERVREDHAFFYRAAQCGFGIDALLGAVVNHGGCVSRWQGVFDEWKDGNGA
jgi:hypothetical protein